MVSFDARTPAVSVSKTGTPSIFNDFAQSVARSPGNFRHDSPVSSASKLLKTLDLPTLGRPDRE